MSTPISPTPPPSGPFPIAPTFSGSGTANFTPVDFFETSLAQQLQAPSFDASNPRLSIADFYGAISSANLAQKLREFLDGLNDPLFRKALMKFASEQASYMSEIITLVYQYDTLSRQLENIDLPGKAGKINSKLAAYGGVENDNLHIDQMNTAANNYNAAKTVYHNALVTYQNALNAYEAAQTAYDNALNTWNAALASYQAGTITQTQLDSARSIFNSAQAQFNTSLTSFNSAQTTFNNAKTTWQNAVNAYNSALTAYNTYKASRDAALAELNAAIAEWNSSFSTASSVIAKMNAIREELGLSPVTSTGELLNFSGLPTITAPTGPSSLTLAVQGDVNEDNNLVNLINQIIGAIGVRVTSINAGGYDPQLTTPVLLGSIPSIPTNDSDLNAATYSHISIPTHITITTPEEEDLITTYLEPRLAILFEIQNKTTKEDIFREDTENTLFNPVSGKFKISAGGGGSFFSTTNAVGIAASPFVSSILSKHAFEAFFNVYGVPVGSPLVDQIGALYTQIETNIGLASAGPANAILNNAVLNGSNGQAAVNASIALGNLSIVNEISNGTELRQAIAAILENDPSLAHLTPEQKNALLEGIVGEIGASLNKSALNELARALGLPGLMPQILALLAGITAHDPLASFSQQLFRNVLFAQELAKAFQISDAEANLLIETAIKEQSGAPSSIPPQQAGDPVEERAVIERSVTEQLIKTGIVRYEVEQKVQRAAQVADDGVRQEQLKSNYIKTQAFKDSLVKSFALLELDPVKADLLAAEIPIGSINEITSLLINKGLTLQEANQVASQALNAANLNDPNQNPLSSFLIQQLGTTTEMAGLLKGQIVNILSPAVGMRNALNVAENYGSLVFSTANSITGQLQVNERRLDALSYFIYDIRLYENYREATINYRSPELAPDNPLKLGKTLLLTGIPGGLSNQGLTSQDNTLGPSANQSKHATSYPGIFG